MRSTKRCKVRKKRQLSQAERWDRELLRLEHNLDVHAAQLGLIWDPQRRQWVQRFRSLFDRPRAI